MPKQNKPIRDPIVILRKKIDKAIREKNKLLLSHANDDKPLKHHYSKYNEYKRVENKKGYLSYKKLHRLNTNIRKFSETLKNTYGMTVDVYQVPVDEPNATPVIVKCANCNRRPILNCTFDYQLNLHTVNSGVIIGRRAFSFLSGTRSDHSIDYSLCQQCTIHLTNDDKDIANKPDAIWPAFYWSILRSNEIHKYYDSNFIWRIIPLVWRKWWYDEIKLQFPSYYDNGITLLKPDAIFIDRTADLKLWNEAMQCQQLSSIAKVCNQLLLPTVLCPWGCSEFIHSTGYLDVDTVLQRFFQKCNLSVISASKLSKVEHARDDYFRESINEYDVWLYNPDWKVLPTIVFVKGYPRILTCKDHDGGCNLIQVHCCRWRSNIAAPLSDQVCHAVVKPRTVKNMKVGYNSTGYQMVEQRSSWKGPDSINVSSVGKTDHGSVLVQEAEARSYANRTDMKSLIQRLIDDGKMSDDHAEGIEEFSNSFSTKIDYEKYRSGSNYVPAEIAMAMKQEEKNREVVGIIDDDEDDEGNLLPEYSRKFKRIWPLYIYPCQKNTLHGAKMYTVPSFKVSGSRLLWIVSSLLLHVEPLWCIIAKGQLRRSEWQGHLLMYLTKKCLSHLNRRAVGIFKVLNITELIHWLERYVDLGKSFIVCHYHACFNDKD
jgi:hypothetical protein